MQEPEPGVEAPRIHIVASRVGAGPAEGMNTTRLAEPVLGFLCVETIGGKVVLSLHEDEVFGRCYEVHKALLGADRAITLERLGDIDSNLEANTSTVAASLVPGSCWVRHVFPLFDDLTNIIRVCHQMTALGGAFGARLLSLHRMDDHHT